MRHPIKSGSVTNGVISVLFLYESDCTKTEVQPTIKAINLIETLQKCYLNVDLECNTPLEHLTHAL